MADSRIKDLPDAAPLVDTDFLAVDGAATGTRKASVSTLKAAAASSRPFVASVSGLTISVSAGTRLLRSGASVSYGGGSIAAPGTDGTYYLTHTAANALAILSTWPTALDALVLARVTVTSSGTVVGLAPHAPLGGDMNAAQNLADLTNFVTARTNLQVDSPYTDGGTISAAGNTNVTFPANIQQSIFFYDILAGTGNYVATVTLQNAARAGVEGIIMFRLPASGATPTIQVLAQGSGVPLFSFTGRGFTQNVMFRGYFNGNSWQSQMAGVLPFAGRDSAIDLDLSRPTSGGVAFPNAIGGIITAGADTRMDEFTVALQLAVIQQADKDVGLSQGLFGISGQSIGGGVSPYEFFGYIPANSSVFSFAFRDAAGALTGTAFNVQLLQWYGRVIALTCVRKAGVLEVYVNGELQTGTQPTNADKAQGSLLGSFRVGSIHAAAGGYPAPIHAFRVFNRALTIGEVRELHINGINSKDRWGCNTPSYTSDFSAGVDNWGTSATGTVTGNQDSILGQNDCLRFEANTANTAHLFFRALGARNKRWRISFDYYIPAVNAVMVGMYGSVYNGGLPSQSPMMKARGAWTSFTWEAPLDPNTAGGNTNWSIYTMNASDNSTFTGVAGEYIYLRNVVVQQLGAVIDLDLAAGCGNCIPDRSSNEYHGQGSGTLIHSMPQRMGQTSQRLRETGILRLADIPLNARIRHIAFNNREAAPITVALGTASAGSTLLAPTSVPVGVSTYASLLPFSVNGQIWTNVTAGTPTAANGLMVTVAFELG